jgi:hypothetical protein
MFEGARNANPWFGAFNISQIGSLSSFSAATSNGQSEAQLRGICSERAKSDGMCAREGVDGLEIVVTEPPNKYLEVHPDAIDAVAANENGTAVCGQYDGMVMGLEKDAEKGWSFPNQEPPKKPCTFLYAGQHECNGPKCPNNVYPCTVTVWPSGGWNTHKVVSFASAFKYAVKADPGPQTYGWNVENVRTLQETFRYCRYCELDLSYWKITNKVTNMYDTFRYTNKGLLDKVYTRPTTLPWDGYIHGSAVLRADPAWQPRSVCSGGASGNPDNPICTNPDYLRGTLPGTVSPHTGLIVPAYGGCCRDWDTSGVTTFKYAFKDVSIADPDFSSFSSAGLKITDSNTVQDMFHSMRNAAINLNWGTCGAAHNGGGDCVEYDVRDANQFDPKYLHPAYNTNYAGVSGSNNSSLSRSVYKNANSLFGGPSKWTMSTSDGNFYRMFQYADRANPDAGAFDMAASENTNIGDVVDTRSIFYAQSDFSFTGETTTWHNESTSLLAPWTDVGMAARGLISIEKPHGVRPFSGPGSSPYSGPGPYGSNGTLFWNMERATSLQDMFRNSNGQGQFRGDISLWNTHKVENFMRAFQKQPFGEFFSKKKQGFGVRKARRVWPSLWPVVRGICDEFAGDVQGRRERLDWQLLRHAFGDLGTTRRWHIRRAAHYLHFGVAVYV